MTFNESRSTVLLSTSQTNSREILNQSTELSTPNICQVCGNKARCSNYGAITCLSCRAFFRRHGIRSKNIRACPLIGQCEVRLQNRQQKTCISCRLAKCLAAGMNVSFFREVVQKDQKSSSRTKVVDTIINQYKPSKCVSQLPTLDLLNRNRSNLSSTHWTLLSNVVYAYDNFSPIPSTSCAVSALSRLPTSQLSDVPIMRKVIESVLTSLVTLYRSIPDFQILTIAEQRSLIQRNISGTCCLNFMFVLRDSGCIDSSAFIKDYTSTYGMHAVSRIKHFTDQIDSDSTLVKLLLIILTFSSNCSVLTAPTTKFNDTLLLGTFRLLGSQNVYVELLWKYMVYRYGDHQTVIRFAQLIKHVVDLIDHLTNVCMKVNVYRFDLDSIFFENKRSFINSPNEHIPVWGNI